MKIVDKGNVVVTHMTREETGLVSPGMLMVLNPIIKRGWSLEDAQEIKIMMDNHGLSLEAAEVSRKESLEWLNEF